tara:strand:- start:6421 stop:7800 length:1380 start_codon:yes stop_codon:yes gene_type:complete
MAINYSYPSGSVAGDDLVLIMDTSSTGKPTRTVSAQSIANLYNAGGVAGVASFTTSLSGLTPNVATTGAVTLAGTLGVPSGGTGVGTLTSNGVLFGGGTGPIEATAVGSSGQVLTSNGAGLAPTFQAGSGSGITSLNAQTGATQTFTNMANGVTITSAGNAHALGLAGQIPTGNGGTGLSSYQIGDLIYASGANTLNQLTIGTTGQVLKVVGGVPVWGNLINQAEIQQYNIPVGDAAGEIATSSRILIGRSAANSVEIGNNASANLVYINNTDASSATIMYGQTRFPVTYDGTTNNNLAFGNNALNASISGDENTAIGVGSMIALTSGSDNTALGKDSASALLAGSNNIVIGKNAGATLATGSGNTLIGKEANVSAASAANSIAIGGLASVGTGSIAIGRSTSAANSGIAIGEGAVAGANAISLASSSTPLTLSSGNTAGTTQLPIKINGVQYYINLFV